MTMNPGEELDDAEAKELEALRKTVRMASNYATLRFATSAVLRCQARLHLRPDDAFSVVEAAYWIGAAAESVDAQNDGLLSAFYFVRNLGVHHTHLLIHATQPKIGSGHDANATLAVCGHLPSPLHHRLHRRDEYRDWVATMFWEPIEFLLPEEGQIRDRVDDYETMLKGQNVNKSIQDAVDELRTIRHELEAELNNAIDGI